jgi:hypothetical protein
VEDKLFDRSDRKEFKKAFAIAWLAAYEANEYTNNCHRGWKNHAMPVEDAECLADRAWDQWVDVNGVNDK